MTASEIRQAFLDFFASKGHVIVPSAPIVIKNDPTLMFTNAGMNQFKDIFLGEAPAKNPRVADTQRCLRVSGKHNDLEEVGIDTYHHTMFEMLGNWSFGDYFKKEAIAWSWELLTGVYKLPKDRLYVTYFEGDEKEGLEKDTETYDLWKQYVDESRILPGNKKDNFWEMGETGPCGPCSEIHYDSRPDAERNLIEGATLVNADHDQVIEIWNNVFMQFNRVWGGKSGNQKEFLSNAALLGEDDSKKWKSVALWEYTTLNSLPAKHVDTGMGFERLVRVLQGKTSNYDTDIFKPLIDYIAEKSKKEYHSSITFEQMLAGKQNEAIAMRVMSDHIRAISFAIADGQLPSNNKAGYVIRRILRRAVRYQYQYLGFKEPFLNTMVPLLAEQFKGVFDELWNQKDFVQRVILEEENSFLKTLEAGMQIFNDSVVEDILENVAEKWKEIDIKNLPVLNNKLQEEFTSEQLINSGLKSTHAFQEISKISKELQEYFIQKEQLKKNLLENKEIQEYFKEKEEVTKNLLVNKELREYLKSKEHFKNNLSKNKELLDFLKKKEATEKLFQANKELQNAFFSIERIKDIFHNESNFKEFNNLNRVLEPLIKVAEELMLEPIKIAGDVVFKLQDTYGFPVDLTELMANETGSTIDSKGFNKALTEQKSRSRAATAIDTGDWIVLKEEDTVEFTGYDETETIAHIVKYRKVTAKGKEQYQMVLDKTPFYAESGGQVGDTGELVFPDGEVVEVTDTKKENGLIVHYVDKLPSEEAIDDVLTAIVDPERRNSIMNNHSATHLLHAALKQVLGKHVNQKGSLVNADYLRFDFSHFAKVTDEELAQIETIVNHKIRENITLNEQRNVPYNEAINSGVTALFGEKYGDYVRVITFDEKFSKELCGGTHVKATGYIGFFKIITESAVAAGVRRIEAITGIAAENYINEQSKLIHQLRELLKNPKDIGKSVETLLDENARLKKEIEKAVLEKSSGLKNDLVKKVQNINGINFIAEKVELPNADAIKNLAYQLKDIVTDLFLVLAAKIDGKPNLTVMISENLVKDKGLNAGNIVRELAKEIKGGGGGQPFFATAGGSDVSGLDKALIKAKNFIV